MDNLYFIYYSIVEDEDLSPHPNAYMYSYIWYRLQKKSDDLLVKDILRSFPHNNICEFSFRFGIMNK
jgi:hypothetical protein